MEIKYTSFVKQYLNNNEFEQLKEEISKKLPIFISNNYFRIKIIKNIKYSVYKFYEFKIHIKNNNYRVAFTKQNDIIIICYINNKLKKDIFDKEFKKYYKSHQKNFLETY